MALIVRKHRRTPHLNLTPLIDVIFLLIVFFMLTSRFSLDSVLDAQIASASASTEKVSAKRNAVLVLLEDEKHFKLWSEDGAGSKELQSMAKLQSAVAPLLVRDKSREIIVVVKDETKVEQALQAMELIKHAGAQKIKLAEGL